MGLISSSGYRPNVSFTLLNIPFRKTSYIVRHQLDLLLERASPLMNLKLRRIEQSDYVEGLINAVLWDKPKRSVGLSLAALC